MIEKEKPAKPAVSPARVLPVSRPERAVEHGGPKGPEPTRYDDWEKGGRCIDF